jgi:predicted GH43/DUF377 family glycosyl hydrolase
MSALRDKPAPTTRLSRRLFLAACGGAGLAATAGAAGRALLLAPQPGRAYLPYRGETAAGWRKFAGNPVLGGPLGTCFDVCVLREGGLYRMWFSWRPRKSIGYVESPDGIQWTSPRTALGPDVASGWEVQVNRPCVLRLGNTFHMWYTGQTADRSEIGYARSVDGIQWERVSAQPVLSPRFGWEMVAVMTPSVLWDADRRRFRLWYSAGDQYEPNAIGYAESPDGIHWSRPFAGPIFLPSRNGWDRQRVTAPQVIHSDGWYLMFYIGFYNQDSAEIGLTRSRDGMSGWERLPDNPIIRPAHNSGRWDYDAVYRPWAIPGETDWLLWYNGRRGSLEQIGLARHEGLDLWT